jgi:N-acetylneuraminate synthase
MLPQTLSNLYLIAEIGQNHNKDMVILKKLIDASFACGWNCVKFQKRTPDICIPENQKFIIKDTPWGKLSYLDYRKKIELNKEDYDFIDKYCKEKPIDWSASVWDIPSLEFILQYDIPFIKIPSAKLIDYKLLMVAAQTNKKIILSTGMSTLNEIDKAVKILNRNAKEFILMHTNSSYPTPIEELNLSIIKTLQDRYNCEVGYSGHEYGLEPTVIAVSLGVKIIERHITIDHNLWGTDQISSLEITGMDMLYKRIKDIPIILGNNIKKITKSELPIRTKLRGE